MLKKLFILALVFSLYSSAANADSINSQANLKKSEYESLEVNGNLNFEDLNVKSSLEVNGNLEGNNLKCRWLEVNGSSEIDSLSVETIETNGSFAGTNVEIGGNAQFCGDVSITNGRLNDITIASTRATFTDSKVLGNIKMQKVNQGWQIFGLSFSNDSKQVLILKNTVISGDVIFEDEGEIHIINDSEIKGQVVNGKVVKE